MDPLGTILSPTFLYSASGQLLVESNPPTFLSETTCAGESPIGDSLTLRKDYVYLFGVPVAVLFSSPDVATPECGHNFIVPNHLGTPLRMIDQQGLTTQSPEPGPYGGTNTQPFNMNNGPQYEDNLAVWDSSTSTNVPYLTQASITDPGGALGSVTTYAQTLTVPGASSLQIQLFGDFDLNSCTDTVTVQGSAVGDTPETLRAGAMASSPHAGESITVTLNFTEQCTTEGGTCDCSAPHGDYTVASVTANYAQDTNTVTLSLPGMFSMPLEGSAANWHRFFLGLPSNYMSPDPAMRWQRFAAMTGDPYSYADGNPLVRTDPTGLFPPAPVPVPPPAWPVVAAGAVGVGVGLGINYFISNWIQNLLTPLLPNPDPNSALVPPQASATPNAPPQEQTPLPRGDPDWAHDGSHPQTNPGRGGDGNCLPCPPDSPVWWHQHEDGTCNSHAIRYNQNPVTCECFPQRTHE
jgi:hypothetical protein